MSSPMKNVQFGNTENEVARLRRHFNTMMRESSKTYNNNRKDVSVLLSSQLRSSNSDPVVRAADKVANHFIGTLSAAQRQEISASEPKAYVLARRLFSPLYNSNYAYGQTLHVNLANKKNGHELAFQFVYFVNNQQIVQYNKQDPNSSTVVVNNASNSKYGQGFSYFNKSTKATTLRPRAGAKTSALVPEKARHKANVPVHKYLRSGNNSNNSKLAYKRDMFIIALYRPYTGKTRAKVQRLIAGGKHKPINVSNNATEFNKQIRLKNKKKQDLTMLLNMFGTTKNNWGKYFVPFRGQHTIWKKMVTNKNYLGAGLYFRDTLKGNIKYYYEALNASTLKSIYNEIRSSGKGTDTESELMKAYRKKTTNNII